LDNTHSNINNLIGQQERDVISHSEDIEESFTDGTKSKTYKSVKDIVGPCPQLGTNQAYGRQTRETKENTNKNAHSFTDDKTETIIDNFGNKITRSSKSANVKYTTGFRTPTSSLFEQANNSSHATQSDHAFSFLNPNNIFPSINSQYAIDEKQRSLLTETEAQHNESDFQFTHEHTRDSNGNTITQKTKSSTSQSPDSSLFEQSNLNANTFYTDQHVPVFYPYPGTQMNQSKLSNFTSNLLTTTSFYPISTDSIRSMINFNSSSSENTHLSDEKYGVMSQIRSTPTIKEIVPPTFSVEIENATVKKGGTAYFKGTINGSFPFETTWYIDNYELRQNNQIETSITQDERETFLTGLIDYIISLKIRNCSISDIGKYTALVRNEAGDASCSAFLIIEENFEITEHDLQSQSFDSLDSYATVCRSLDSIQNKNSTFESIELISKQNTEIYVEKEDFKPKKTTKQ
jgi:hypothetical protein